MIKKNDTNKINKGLAIFLVATTIVLIVLLFVLEFIKYGFSLESFGNAFIIFLLCAFAGGMIFAVTFFIKRVQRGDMDKPLEIDYKICLKKIKNVEKRLMIRTENRYVGYILRNLENGRPPIQCVAAVYFLADKMFGAHVFKNDVYTTEIPYRQIVFSNVVRKNLFFLTLNNGLKFRMFIKNQNDADKLKRLLIQMRLFVRRCLATTGKLFINFNEVDYESDYYAEIRFCDDDFPSPDKFVFREHAEDSLYICEEDFPTFFKEYDGVLNIGDKDKYDLFKKAQYYSVSDAEEIISTIKAGIENGDDYIGGDDLCAWLAEAASNHNGFYVS